MDFTAQLQVADVLEGQMHLNTTVARALESLALQSDRYDAELAELRDEIAGLARRLDVLASIVTGGNGPHSLRVAP